MLESPLLETHNEFSQAAERGRTVMHPANEDNDDVRRSSPAHLSRRELLVGTAALGAASLISQNTCVQAAEDKPVKTASAPSADWKVTSGRVKQSVVHWCFNPMEVETLARASSQMGLRSVELVDPKYWPLLKELGLACAISSSHGFVKGFNHVENHAECLEKLTASIDATSAAGFPSVITFSGMRQGISDEEGMKNTVDGLKKIIGHAEKKKVNVCIEMLNSRVDIEMKGHPDYQCDTIEWAAEVCKRVGSPRMKILFDIYHVQIMQGDIITRIKQFKDYIGHYHTAGVPGRNELDQLQEINYEPIMRAIVETGYQGYVGQEFIPREPDKIASLRQAVQLCDV
jgi:hydroxypyruvate isomerase